jgi:hypothetical protein
MSFAQNEDVDKDSTSLTFDIDRGGMLEAQLGFGIGLGFTNDRPQFVDGTVLADLIIQPKLGYFVHDRVQFGLQLTTYVSVTGINATDNIFLNYNLIGPYLRYEISPSFFAEIGRGWGSGREEIRENSEIISESRFNSAGWQPRIGIVSNWSDRLRFSLLISYNITSNKFEDEINNFEIRGFGLQPTVGYSF